jgi:hypothetical protein
VAIAAIGVTFGNEGLHAIAAAVVTILAVPAIVSVVILLYVWASHPR